MWCKNAKEFGKGIILFFLPYGWLCIYGTHGVGLSSVECFRIIFIIIFFGPKPAPRILIHSLTKVSNKERNLHKFYPGMIICGNL